RMSGESPLSLVADRLRNEPTDSTCGRRTLTSSAEGRTEPMKRAALYARVSTVDQHLETHLLADARRHRFDIVLVSAFDRVARNVRHFLEVLDELNHLGIEFVSLRENIDTGGPLGRAMVVIVGAIAQVERQAIVERVRAGMRRAKLEGRQIGRAPLRIDRLALLHDREGGMSLNQLARAYRISKASVCRIVKDAKPPVSGGFILTASTFVQDKELVSSM